MQVRHSHFTLTQIRATIFGKHGRLDSYLVLVDEFYSLQFTVIWSSPAGFWATSRQLSPFSNHAYFVCLVASWYPHVL